MEDLDRQIKETEKLLADLNLQRLANLHSDQERHFELLLAQAVNQPAEVEYDYKDNTLDLLFTPTTRLLSYLIENHPYYRMMTDGGVGFSLIDDYTWEFRLSGPAKAVLALCEKYHFKLDCWTLGHDIQVMIYELQARQDMLDLLEKIGNANSEQSD